MKVRELTAHERQQVIGVIDEALSGEYHSFVGHLLGSNPYLPPGTEKDLELLERIRDEENRNCRALLVQLARYRAGPAIHAFRHWKHDLNFLGLDFLVVRAAEVATEDVKRLEALSERLPEDPELRATFRSVVETKRRHRDELAQLAAKRGKERDARRAASYAATAIPLKKGAPAKPAAKAPGAPGAKAPGVPAPPRPPGAPKPPGPPLPPGAPKPPGIPRPPSSGPKPPGPPSPPKPPGAPTPPRPPGPPKPPGPPAPPKPPTSGPTPPKPPGPSAKPPGPPQPYKPKPPEA